MTLRRKIICRFIDSVQTESTTSPVSAGGVCQETIYCHGAERVRSLLLTHPKTRCVVQANMHGPQKVNGKDKAFPQDDFFCPRIVALRLVRCSQSPPDSSVHFPLCKNLNSLLRKEDQLGFCVLSQIHFCRVLAPKCHQASGLSRNRTAMERTGVCFLYQFCPS